MNRSTIYSRTVSILDTNATAYPQAIFNSDLNESLELRTLEILRLKGYKEVSLTHAYTDFVSTTGLSDGDNGYNGEYALPTDLLDIERIEVTFDGSNWFVLTKDNGRLYDLTENNTSEQDATTIANNFSKNNPYATIYRGSIHIKPLNDGETQTSGLHIYYTPRQTNFDEDTDAPVFESNLHQCLIYDCAEFEMLRHPKSYDNTKLSRVLNKRSQLDREFKNFYRTRLKPAQEVKYKEENFN